MRELFLLFFNGREREECVTLQACHGKLVRVCFLYSGGSFFHLAAWRLCVHWRRFGDFNGCAGYKHCFYEKQDNGLLRREENIRDDKYISTRE